MQTEAKGESACEEGLGFTIRIVDTRRDGSRVHRKQ